MAQYDFTVRAEDETGAFTDRTFNIEVQNNLVDKFAFSDGTDIYSSIDGTTWTKRAGKGGQLDELFYENGYWVGIDANQTERKSKDCINWIEVAGVMNITNLHSSFDGNVDRFYYNYYSMTTIGGWTYLPLYNIRLTGVNGNLILDETPLARTKDFVDFEILQYDETTTYNDVYLNSGLLQTLGYAFMDDTMSNIVRFNDYYIMTHDNAVYRSSSLLQGWELLIDTGGSNFTKGYNKLFNLNGILVQTTDSSSSNSADTNSRIYFSTDAVNWTETFTANSNISTSWPTSSMTYNNFMMYSNGVFMINNVVDDQNKIEYSISTDLVTWYSGNNEIDIYRERTGCFVYKGLLYAHGIDSSDPRGFIYDISITNITKRGEWVLPSTPTTNIAVIK